MVHLQELHERYADKGLVILGFNCADKKNLAEALLKKKGVTFLNILDSSDAANTVAFRRYKVSGVPLNYVIDRKGRVLDAWYDFRKDDPRLKNALEKLGIRQPTDPAGTRHGQAKRAQESPAPIPASGRDLGSRDINRIRELHHLTDVLGDKLWPGFDTREIPIAINNDNRQEMLIGHPTPPREFRVFKGHEIDGKAVVIRDGVTRFGPTGGGGWAVILGGAHTAYMNVLQKGHSVERYLSVLLHECFHVYQDRYRERGEGKTAPLPTDNPVYSAFIGLESRILHAALLENRERELHALCRMFVAVRNERRRGFDARVVFNEGEQEYSEGTAAYVQARLFQILAQRGGIKPSSAVGDAAYGGFADAASGYLKYVSGVLPATSRPITFFHSKYKNGMAQCLLLDRVRPGWKQEMRAKGSTQYELLERQFPITDQERGVIVAEAAERFEYDALLAAQKRVISDRLAEIKRLLEAKGTRYRVYHSPIQGPRKWKPRGPVYRVPPSLLGDEAQGIRVEGPQGQSRTLNPMVSIWVGGIRHFEKGSLLFESGAVPIISRPDYLEWIDTDPDLEGKDLKIESVRVEDGVHHGLKITTDGFTLNVGCARVERSGDIVSIRPIEVR